MINYSNLYKFYDLFGEIIFYGFNNHFSNNFIEESISSSIIFKNYLNKGDDSFINNFTKKDILKLIYKVDLNHVELDKTNTLSMWLSEAYLRLFFKYHKSMEFIFLYLPIDKMSYMFDAYHEMDWRELYDYFLELIEKKSALSLLLKDRKITIYELSVLTGLKKETIKSYSRNNKNIYKASFNNVLKITEALNVDCDVFIEEISNYIDASSLELQIKNIKYLSGYAYYIISYFDKSIGEKEFIYDDRLEVLKSDDLFIKVLVIDSIKMEYIKNEISKNQIQIDNLKTSVNYVIFTINDIDDINLVNFQFDKFYLITPSKIFFIDKKSCKVEKISISLHESAIKLANINDEF